MKNKKILLNFFLTLLLFASILTIVNCYSNTDSYTDPDDDATTPDTEIVIVWIDNNATHLQFKVEMKEPWNFTLYNVLYAFTSIDPLTGDTGGGFIDFNADYVIGFSPTLLGEPQIVFYDYNNLTNNLDVGLVGGVAFSKLTNNNKTIEFGWKLKAYYNGKGYLNVSMGDTIQIKFYAGGDSDFAPDEGLDPLNYTVKSASNNQIPGFNTILITTWSIGTIIVLVFIKKYKYKS